MIQLKVHTIHSLPHYHAKLTADQPNQSMLNCIDNSGAAIVECAMVVGQKRHASIGTHARTTLPPTPGKPQTNPYGTTTQATG